MLKWGEIVGIQLQHCRCVGGETTWGKRSCNLAWLCVCGVYEKASLVQFVLRLLSMIVVLYPQILSPPAPPKLDEIWLRKRTVTQRFVWLLRCACNNSYTWYEADNYRNLVFFFSGRWMFTKVTKMKTNKPKKRDSVRAYQAYWKCSVEERSKERDI